MNRKNQVKPPSFRLADRRMKRVWMPIVAGLMLSACRTPTQMLTDTEVDRLCAIDGGVKVYETVALPPEKFNEWGQVNFYDPTQGENTLGPGYVFKRERNYLRKDKPSILRSHHEVIRRADDKLLGETTYYSRGGGDLPGPWQPSSYECPPINDAGVNALLKQIFINPNK